jgi:hypothetical protein
MWLLLAFAILLGGFSLYLNKDWFAKDNIQISHRSRPARGPWFRRGKRADDSPINPIVFLFDRRVSLKSIKVVPLSDIETNKYPQPVWHLVSDSNSVPLKDLTYGIHVPGMRPAVKGIEAKPLEPGIQYRLFVEAGTMKAEHDFAPEPRTQ